MQKKNLEVLDKELDYTVEKVFYLIPKSELSIFNLNFKSLKEFEEKFEDYKLNKLSASEIKYMLDAMDEEDDIVMFGKHKAKDMLIACVKSYKIGKYKYGQLKFMENL